MISTLLRNSGLLIVSISLLFGGATILTTNIPFWSILYGTTAVCLGIITSIITFVEIAKPIHSGNDGVHYVRCSVCHKQSLAPYLIDKVVCAECQYKIALKMNVGVMVFFILLAIPVSSHLISQKQTIYQQAKEQRTCDPGLWQPISCQCGTWDTSQYCNQGTSGKVCGNKIYCCEEIELGNWACVEKNT